MATRSFISIQKENKTFEGIYCHWDGYPEGVGKTLEEHYTNLDTIKALMRGGSISSLAQLPEACPSLGSKSWSQVFSTKTELQLAASNLGCEYLYLHENGRWTVTKLEWDLSFQ